MLHTDIVSFKLSPEPVYRVVHTFGGFSRLTVKVVEAEGNKGVPVVFQLNVFIPLGGAFKFMKTDCKVLELTEDKVPPLLFVII